MSVLRILGPSLSLLISWLAARGYFTDWWSVLLATAALAVILSAAFLIAISVLVDNVQRLTDDELRTWDQVNEFPLWHAAMLWDGKRLTTNRALSESGCARFRMLKERIKAGTLKPAGNLDDRSEPNRNTIVGRAALRQLADSLGEKPAFLFPEARKSR